MPPCNYIAHRIQLATLAKHAVDLIAERIAAWKRATDSVTVRYECRVCGGDHSLDGHAAHVPSVFTLAADGDKPDHKYAGGA